MSWHDLSMADVWPDGVEAAIRAQLEVRRGVLASGAEPVGWKTTTDLADVGGLEPDNAVLGYLTTATRVGSGEPVKVGPALDLCAEVELAVVLDHDVAPQADPFTAAEAIQGWCAAVEIVDIDRRSTVAEVVATNVFHRAFAVGPMRPYLSSTGTSTGTGLVPVPPASAQLLLDQRVVETKTVRLDPVATVVTLSRLLAAVGKGLRAGEVLLGGSLLRVPLDPRQQVTVKRADLGEACIVVDN